MSVATKRNDVVEDNVANDEDDISDVSSPKPMLNGLELLTEGDQI
jgi:hypothetical protein